MSAALRKGPQWELPDGYRWIENGGTFSMVKVGDADTERSEAERAAYREWFHAQEAAQRAERERASTVAAKVAALLAAGDREHGTARAALLDCIDRIEGARVEHRRTEQKAAAHAVAAERLDQARAALAELEASVRSHFQAFAEYGAGTVRPDERVEERAALQSALSSAQWRFDLSATAYGDGLGVDVAAGVVEALRDRLPALRHAVCVEASAPIAAEIDQLTARLQSAYAVLIALGAMGDGSGMLRAGSMTLPALPHGRPSTIDVAASLDASAAWGACMAALEHDPNAVITIPGEVPATTPPPAGGPLRFVRSAVRLVSR